MDRLIGRLAIMLCILGFGVFYGINLSKEGMERIHGPLEQAHAAQRPAQSAEPMPDAAARAAVEAADGTAPMQGSPDASTPSKERVRPEHRSLIGAVLDGAGNVLNRAADLLIRLLVKLGEAVLS